MSLKFPHRSKPADAELIRNVSFVRLKGIVLFGTQKNNKHDVPDPVNEGQYLCLKSDGQIVHLLSEGYSR